MRIAACDHRPIVRRIERHEFLERHFRELGGELHVDLRRHLHGGEIRRVRNGSEGQAERLRALDDVLDRLQLGQIVARLRRHLEAQVVGGLSVPAVLLDRARHGALAPVVGGERELPIAELVVQLLQIIERAVGRSDDIAPGIEPPVLLQTIELAGARYELPDTGCAAARERHGVVRAFDHGQQRDFERHAAFLDFRHDEIQIARAALDHPRDIVRPRGIPRFMLAHQRIVQVGQRETGAQMGPHIGMGSHGLGDRWHLFGFFDGGPGSGRFRFVALAIWRGNGLRHRRVAGVVCGCGCRRNFRLRARRGCCCGRGLRRGERGCRRARWRRGRGGIGLRQRTGSEEGKTEKGDMRAWHGMVPVHTASAAQIAAMVMKPKRGVKLASQHDSPIFLPDRTLMLR